MLVVSLQKAHLAALWVVVVGGRARGEGGCWDEAAVGGACRVALGGAVLGPVCGVAVTRPGGLLAIKTS